MKNLQAFHNSHEEFTKKAYENPDLLPDRYVFILTNLCNLRCDFCFQNKLPSKDSMTELNWNNLIEQLPNYARVTLCGGEPLMFKGFKNVFSKIANKFKCNIITNGLLLNENLTDFLLSFKDFRVLSVSIDDIGNNIRGFTKEQWNRLVCNINYFVNKKNEINKDCILDIKTMILDRNSGDLFNIYRYFVEEMKIDTHSFQFLKGSPIQHADINYKFEDILNKSKAYTYKKFTQIKKQLKLVQNYNIKQKRQSFLHPKFDTLMEKTSLSGIDCLNKAYFDKSFFKPCKFPWSSVHINFNGNLFPCLSINMGNVKFNPLIDIIKGDKFKKFRKLIRNKGTIQACNRCGWLRPLND